MRAATPGARVSSATSHGGSATSLSSTPARSASIAEAIEASKSEDTAVAFTRAHAVPTRKGVATHVRGEP